MKKTINLKKDYIDSSVRPQDDFFQYACGTWLKQNPIPKTESSWGAFYMLRDDGLKRTQKIFKELSQKKNLKKGSEAQLVRDFYLAGMNMSLRNKLGIKPIQKKLKDISAIEDTQAMWRFLFQSHKEGTQYLWHYFVGQDDKNSNSYMFHLTQGGLSMPDREFYLKDDKRSQEIREAFITYVSNVLHVCGYAKDDAQKSAVAILAFETKIARASMSKTDAHNIDKVYHKYTFATFKKTTPKIPWNHYLKILGIHTKNVVVYQPKFFPFLEKLVLRTPIKILRAYLHFVTFDDAASSLSQKCINLSFSFHGKVLYGREKLKPNWKRIASALDAYLGEAVGKEYVKRYFSEEAKKAVFEMVKNLILAYRVRIENISWMTPQTKKKALLKLSQVNLKLGYPDKWRSYKGLIIKPDDHYGNSVRVVAYEQKRMRNKLGKVVDKKEWFMPPQTVNAYYDPNNNDIVFPAGILQPPFFDPKGDDAINYGAMGSVIGHELTHGFDNSGAKFDGKGNYRNWWNKEDKKRFEKKTKILEKQFNEYKVGDLHVNGKFTLGENIADLGGLAMAYDAYQTHLKKTKRKNIQGFTPEQRYFFGLSVFEASHSKPEFARTMIMVDPHSPAKFRVNGPYSNLECFYKAFNVKKGDMLYRAPKERAEIW